MHSSRRSRRKKMVRSLESAALRRSLVILMSAVSVLPRGRKPDWNCSYRFIQVGMELRGYCWV